MLYCYVLAIVWIAVLGAGVRAWGELMRLVRVIFLALVVLALGASSALAQSNPLLLGGYADAYRLINRDADFILRAKLPALPIDDTATKASSPGMRKKRSVKIETPAGQTPAEFEAYVRARLDAALAELVAKTLADKPTRYGLLPMTKSGSDSLTIRSAFGPGAPTFSRHTVNAAGGHTIYFELVYG